MTFFTDPVVKHFDERLDKIDPENVKRKKLEPYLEALNGSLEEHNQWFDQQCKERIKALENALPEEVQKLLKDAEQTPNSNNRFRK